MSTAPVYRPPAMLEAEWETHRPAVFEGGVPPARNVADAEDGARDVWR